MKYAVFSQNGKQYKVSEGEEILMDHLNQEKGKTLEFNDVLLVVNDGKSSIGTPTVKGAQVQVQVLDQVKGDKIKVVKYKAKSRYRKSIGFRSQLTRVKIEQILI